MTENTTRERRPSTAAPRWLVFGEKPRYGCRIMSVEDPEARALRESEERFRALSDAAREAVLIHENGVVQDVNQAFTALLGYPRTEVIGQYGSLFIAPD